ncbi:DUF7373 family lipoprotein [Nocardia mangyaensis]|uniref:DUF7373 family lipoprotein n=1 Tax=Nocardia mangyaensis TaxID=2213200 RepID=UPI0026752E88|nr:hypothetical protein [Nocardia mangyaensis]MDO3647243.1 hypothetical protein [Nocardia mangyaensis]
MISSTKIRIVSALCCAIALAAVTGCAVSGTPVAAEPDVRGLATGAYATDHHRYDEPAGDKGSLVEGTRMAAAVVPAMRIDPSLSHGRGGTVIADVSRALDFVANVSRPVLENRGFVVGYAALGADRPDPEGQTRPSAETTAVTTVLLRFPDATAATLAARELEDVDLAVSPENRKLTSTEYPQAYLHWRPGVPTIGAFLAHEDFVISLFIQRPRADSADLIAWVEQALDAELPVLDAFTPTPYDQLADLPVDPDRLLARAVVRNRDVLGPDQHSFAVYSTAHLVNNTADQTTRQELIDATGAERIAMVDGGSITLVRDQAAAEALLTGLVDSAGTYDTLPAPTDVPGAKCLQLNDQGDADQEYKYRCYIPYKRYLGIVSSDQEPDVRQKISAQYALLANSL